MVIAAFGLFQVSIFIGLCRCCNAVTAGNGLTLYEESVCVGLVLYILTIRIGLHLKLFADFLAVFVVLIYGLVSFLILGLFGGFGGSRRGLLLRLYHTAAGSDITHKLSFFINAGIGRNLRADLLNLSLIHI